MAAQQLVFIFEVSTAGEGESRGPKKAHRSDVERTKSLVSGATVSPNDRGIGVR